jgi:hypothetical protein
MLRALALVVVLAAPLCQAAEQCYELSVDGKSFSRTPEVLCVAQVKDKDAAHTLTFRTGLAPVDVVVLHLDLTSAVRCGPTCNRNVYSLANPSNSVLNALTVAFDGKRDVAMGLEQGTVKVGKTVFHYREVPPAVAK